MKEYVYLWIECFNALNDLGGEQYLFEDQGISLSSKYRVLHTYKENKGKYSLTFDIEKTRFPENFFSDEIVDIKALVGENGTGKTTLIKRLLYPIIGSGFVDSMDKKISFVLIYEDDWKNGERKLFYFKSSCVLEDCEILFRNLSCEERNYTDAYKSENVIFYTGAVKDFLVTDQGADGCLDLSTNALLYSDEIDLHNKSNFLKETSKTDCFTNYVTMEYLRKVTFMSQFYEVFANDKKLKFRLPNIIIFAPSNIEIDNAILEIVGADKSAQDEWVILKNSQEMESFEEYFRLAVYLNAVRAPMSNAAMKDKVLSKIKKPNEIRKEGMKKVIEDYDGFLGEDGFSKRVEEALECLGEVRDFQNVILEKFHVKAKEGFYFDMTQERHRVIIKKFVEKCVELMHLTPFFTLNWRTQSSGEENFIKFFSRFYYALKIQKKKDDQNKSEENVKKSKYPDIHLLIDEADLYLHPEWQRCWLEEFCNIMSIILENIYPNNKPNLQVIISTHSPFIITDFPNESIVLLDQNEDKRTIVKNKHEVNPFGANLYDLLNDGFFLENSIGLFSEKLIEALVAYRRNQLDDPMLKTFLEKNAVYIESSIGDPIVRSLVKEMKK